MRTRERDYSERMQVEGYPAVETARKAETPRGFKAVGLFFFFGATMASLAGTTLIWRGTILDRVWALNPSAHKQLVLFGTASGMLFLVLSLTLAFAGAGWFLRRIWGWGLGVGIIAIQVAGDLVSAFMGQFVRGAIGFTIAGALLFYLLHPRVRAAFEKDATTNGRS